MVDQQAVAAKKRTLTYMHANELTGRLTSKADFLKYFDGHRKYLRLYRLTAFQFSTICRTPTSSTKIS